MRWGRAGRRRAPWRTPGWPGADPPRRAPGRGARGEPAAHRLRRAGPEGRGVGRGEDHRELRPQQHVPHPAEGRGVRRLGDREDVLARARGADAGHRAAADREQRGREVPLQGGLRQDRDHLRLRAGPGGRGQRSGGLGLRRLAGRVQRGPRGHPGLPAGRGDQLLHAARNVQGLPGGHLRPRSAGRHERGPQGPGDRLWGRGPRAGARGSAAGEAACPAGGT